MDYTVKNYLNTVLSDDSSGYGGVSFNGETLRDFCSEQEFSEDAPMAEVNKALIKCGIKPIIAEGHTKTVNFRVCCMATYRSSLVIPEDIVDDDKAVLAFVRGSLDEANVTELEWLRDLEPIDAVTAEDIRTIE